MTFCLDIPSFTPRHPQLPAVPFSIRKLDGDVITSSSLAWRIMVPHGPPPHADSECEHVVTLPEE